ncbi:MAG: hypothetical protein JWP91_1856 [Fibrobacteres bacterium]|nr:hypothetical protein [Fibrobacterota bacterium]
MINARSLAALSSFLCVTAAAWAAPMDLDLGVRASIYDENYKLGLGGEVGAVVAAAPLWDMGLHLNYTRFNHKTDTWTDENEFGGYLAAYYRPALDQGFNLRIGPHIGYSKIHDNFLDLGGDVMAVFRATPGMSFYAAFIPSFMIGKDSQSLIRIGFGVEFGPGR